MRKSCASMICGVSIKVASYDHRLQVMFVDMLMLQRETRERGKEERC